MKRFWVFLFVFMFGLSAQGHAGAACYDHREAEAEQGIRIHSELMVIGLNCAHMADANGNNLYLEHKKFTLKHEKLFAKYEKIIMDFMRRNGESNPDKAMHALRTKFANKISTDSAQMRPDIFCRTFSKRIEKASKMDTEAVRKWAATPFPDYPVSKPLCASN
ncbi:MAG: hypothetical protein ACTHOO_10140 [Alcanivorax sp.]